MKLSEVSMDDGRACAHLLNALKVGRFDMTGGDVEAFISAKRWLQALAGDMATQLKAVPQPASASSTSPGFKVKSAGPLPGPAPAAGPSKKSNSKKK